MGKRYNSNVHHRCSMRLQGYDYAQAGAYFVTICTQGRACLFGEVVDGQMWVSDAGRMVQDAWLALPARFANVALDAFVVMPNHVHGIVVLMDDVGAGFSRPTAPNHIVICVGVETAPLRNLTTGSQRPTLGQIVAYFKYQSTKRINVMRGMFGVPVWQRNYYDYIIRNDANLQRIRDYILTNPLCWDLDQLHPANPSKW
jgi:putative transposase